MASLYKRENSPYWWIKFRDPRTNETLRQPTRFKVGVGSDRRAAEQLQATKTLAEKNRPTVKEGKWDLWVTEYIQSHQEDELTRERYLTAWRTLRKFLKEFKIDYPTDLTYQNAAKYVAWRIVPDPTKGKYKVGKNTAILEFKI